MTKTRSQLIAEGKIKPATLNPTAYTKADARAIQARKSKDHLVTATDRAVAILQAACMRGY